MIALIAITFSITIPFSLFALIKMLLKYEAILKRANKSLTLTEKKK